MRQPKQILPGTFLVFGNYGELIVDNKTGKVLGYWHSRKWHDRERAYADIVSFDVEEYRKTYGANALDQTRVDVVDISFTTDKGEFVSFEQDHRDLMRD